MTRFVQSLVDRGRGDRAIFDVLVTLDAYNERGEVPYNVRYFFRRRFRSIT